MFPWRPNQQATRRLSLRQIQKKHCFHARLPINNNLKKFKIRRLAQKEESPQQWLCKGSIVLAVCNTGCTKTLVSEAFANELGIWKTRFLEGKSSKVCLGNSETVTPVAGVEFWATKDA